MYLVTKQHVTRLSKSEHRILKHLCHYAKNLANEAIYRNLKVYREEKRYANYFENYHELKGSVNFKKLRYSVAQGVLQRVDWMFKSFFALVKKKKSGEYSASVRPPAFLPKGREGLFMLPVINPSIKDGIFTLPYSRGFAKTHEKIKVKVPPILEGKTVKYVYIIPKADFFEFQYIYESAEEHRDLDKTKALAIDLGVSNLATCATSTGETFIIDGRKLKSINQWFNKENARLQGIKDKQKIKGTTRRQKAIARKRNNRVDDYMSKAARKIIDFCLEKNIGVLVCGYNADFQRNSRIGDSNNQNFVSIPFGKLRAKLKYLCEFYGLDYYEQEESYTSKASFWDKDDLPVYSEEHRGEFRFSGSRTHRGLYRTSCGYEFNADVNGALNILRKCNVVSLDGLYSRGKVDTPMRIKIS